MAEMTSSPILNEQERAWMSSNTPATEEQVLAWLIEKLTLQGAVGLSTDWLPEQFSSMWDIEVDPSGRISGFTNDESGLRATLNRLNREHARELWLEQVTSHNRALYPRVLTIIESRLLARGIPQERLRALTPRDRLIMLAEVDLPRAPPQPKFTMYLVTAKDATGDTRESTKLFFPYTSTFGHFQCGLRDFTLHSAKRMGRTDGYTLRDGPWIYQLIGPNKAIVPGLPKYSIADETDFREMIRQLRDKDTPMACIFHVSSSSTSAV